MFARYYKLIFLFVVVALCLYLVVLNRDPVTLKLSEQWIFSASGGVIFIAIFALGILCAATFALLLGIKAWFRELEWKRKDRINQLFLQTLSDARGAVASGDLDRATRLWENISLKDPANHLATAELSRCFELRGDSREALRVLDSARANSPDNAEILLRCAELNISLGNRTAAVDNLTLLWFKHSSPKAAEMARDLCEQLGRFDDAIEFHDLLSKVSPAKASHAVRLRLLFGRLMKENCSTEQVEAFLKEHGEFPAALEELARRRAEAGMTAEAASLYARAAASSGDHGGFKKASELWLSLGEAEKALASARSAIKSVDKEDLCSRMALKLNLLSLELTLGMSQAADELITEIEGDLSNRQKLPAVLLERLCLLKAMAEANRSGQTKISSFLQEALKMPLDQQTSGTGLEA